MNESTTLASLAMLKVHADGGRPQDYIDYLKAFAISVLSVSRVTPITRERLHEVLLEQRGLNVPVRGCELVLKRLVNDGYYEKRDGQYHLKKELPQDDNERRWADTQKRGNVVVSKLIAYAEKNHQIELTDEEAAHALLTFLSDFAIECLRSYAQNTALPALKPGKRENLVMVSLFLQDAAKTDVDLFNDVIVIVKGHMLANALLCPDLDDARTKFKDVTFYLDTPIILDLLGLHGKQDKDASEELVSVVSKVDGKLAVFAHNMAEVEGILKYSVEHFNDTGYPNRVIRHAREEGLKGSDITLARARIPDVLRNNKVIEVATPRYSIAHNIDHNVLQEVLEESAKYKYPNARDVDVNSIRSVYVLRAGLRPRKLENAKAVLVTPNSNLSSSAWKFGKRFEESSEVSAVITEFSLGNIAWLKAPLAADNLPRLELISRCYATLEPAPAFWNKFLIEVDKLAANGSVTAEEHAFLRCETLVSKELMSLTLGAESELSQQTVEEVKRRVMAELSRNKDAEIGERDKTIADLTQEKAALLAEKNVPLLRIHKIASLFGNAAAIIIVGCLTLCLIFGLGLPYFVPQVPVWAKWGVSIVFGITIAWSLYNWLTGVSLRHARDKVCSVVTDWCEGVLRRVFGHSK